MVPASGLLDPLHVPVPPELAPAVYSWVRRLALQHDLATADRVLRDALTEITHCLSLAIFYPGEEGLWTMGGDAEMPADPSGIIACAESRHALMASHSALIPVLTTTEVVAVIALTRNPRNPGFHAFEQLTALGLVRECAAIMHHLVTVHLQKQAELAADRGSLYRGEALAAHRGRSTEGPPIHLSPVWVRRTYPFLVGALIVALIFAVFIRVPTYATGQAVIVIAGEPITAAYSGTVGKVMVMPGQRVRAGSVILQMSAQAELNEVATEQAQYDKYATTFLFDPTDEQTKKQLSEQYSRLDAAKKRLEQKTVRAPLAGVISDIRVRTGTPLAVGESIATIVQEGADVQLMAYIPATDRPRLRAGMTAQVQLSGYRRAPELAKIESIGSEAIAGAEVAKTVGSTLADALKLPQGGSFVVVRAKMPSRTFVYQGQNLFLHHGMAASVDVKISDKSFAVSLLPALESYLPE